MWCRIYSVEPLLSVLIDDRVHSLPTNPLPPPTSDFRYLQHRLLLHTNRARLRRVLNARHPIIAMSNSPFLQVTASILATIQQNAEFVRNRVPVHELHVSDPLFDTRPLPSHRKDATAISSHVSSLGLPDDMSLEVATILSEHTSGYQTLVDQTQQRLLHDLSTTTTSLNPTLIPSLVGAACGVFYNSTIDAGLSFLKEQIHVLDGTDHSQSDPEDQSDSGRYFSVL